jgi:hypothetical protein
MRHHIVVHRATTNSLAKSFSFRNKIEEEGLPGDSTPGLEASAQRLVGKLAHLPGEHGLCPRLVRSNQVSATKVSCLSLGADTFDAVGC